MKVGVVTRMTLKCLGKGGLKLQGLGLLTGTKTTDDD